MRLREIICPGSVLQSYVSNLWRVKSSAVGARSRINKFARQKGNLFLTSPDSHGVLVDLRLLRFAGRQVSLNNPGLN